MLGNIICSLGHEIFRWQRGLFKKMVPAACFGTKNHAAALLEYQYLLTFEAEFFRQAYGLTSAVHEYFGGLGFHAESPLIYAFDIYQ